MASIKKWITKNKMASFLATIYVLSLIPVLGAAVYVYPQADDWNYSWQVHTVWENTHSLIEVGKAVAEVVSEAFFEWQGTFSSIALMALQPAVWGEYCYRVVPFLMIGLLTLSTLLFFHEFFRDIKGTEWLSAALLVLLVTVQCMVCKPVAFYWYNGAVHYIFMYSMQLFYVACLVRLVRRGSLGITILGCFLGIFFGGGNLVTGLSGAILSVSAVVWLWLTGRKKRIKAVILPVTCNLAGFLLNISAPGNMARQTASGIPSNPVMSILRSLYYGIEFPAYKWMGWVILLFLLLLIPIAWRMAGKTEFTFPLPLLVAGYSYCLVSAMFTPTDFAAHTVGIGRVQNVIFSTYILVLALSTIYCTGWVRKHISFSLTPKALQKGRLCSAKTYYAVLAVGGVWCTLLTVIPSPEYFTTSLAIHDMLDGSAEEYAETAERNIEILQSEASEVDIYEIPKASRLLTSDDIDQWHFGTKYFYGKDKVNVLPRPEE